MQAAKLGANVTLSEITLSCSISDFIKHLFSGDSALLPKTLIHIEGICKLNKLQPGTDVKVVGLTWGKLEIRIKFFFMFIFSLSRHARS